MLTMPPAHLRITGFKYHEVIDNIFSSLMVDVAYVIEANEQYILVVGEDSENWSGEYKTWLRSVTVETLEKEGQRNLVVEILNS